ncbi:MAG: alpha/beta fold hydrolase [Acidimicrobiales bacterium]
MYDEFSMLAENAAEVGLPWRGAPSVQRVGHVAPSGRRVSGLRWGDDDADPELVLLHGGAHNAHTFDTVALALDRPLVAIDLPGHGHSDWRDDHDYRPSAVADDVAAAIDALAPGPSHRLLVGMSLGGLTALAIAGQRPDLAPRLLLVDVTPGVDRDKAAAIVAFVSGPESFESFDAILERTVAFNPTRSVSSLRRGVLHNAVEQPDGTWTWRYDRLRGDVLAVEQQLDDLWNALEAHRGPLLLARGALSPVVSDTDIAELRRRRPDAEVVAVDSAGHSIQGDRPLALAALIAGWSAASAGHLTG